MAYLKAAKGVDLKSPHQKKKNYNCMGMDVN